jgi:hypothetical protein
MSDAGRDDAAKAQALIPTAFEPRPVTGRQPGAMGGPAFGSLDPVIGPSTMDATTILERQKEGGGGASQRRPRRDAESGS